MKNKKEDQFPLYRYNAEIIRVIDGDTIELLIDEGFKHSWKVSCRLAHINAPELRSSDAGIAAKAQVSKDYLANRLPVGSEVYIISEKLDKYGRPIAEIYFNGVNINDEMLKRGLAVPFM
jgi:micrococcal nuclease